MDWVRDFYSRTGAWWEKADARITDRDLRRVRLLREHGGERGRVLELGSGYGTTAVASAEAGYTVTAIEISDRADQTARLARDLPPGALTLHKQDFYEAEPDGRFDIVAYWNGFGIGFDADQRRLLDRIATRWLRPDGVALIDVFNPFVWAGWDGDDEHLTPDPEAGYEHELRERTRFDPVTCAAVDTWWDAAAPDQKITQVLRCYTPADLALLLTGTGLTLTGIVVGDRVLPPSPQPGLDGLLRDEHEYLAVVRPVTGAS
ncbi:class I SAM-dependent methyltransferase [Spirillospora sp. CA-294931]|uniref:class I SAM-dependent methyltransferase n=1 Tax=Spirillospora sp. CA-294931 TaxID=3240042 RepID=UPI003D9468E2